MVRASVVVPTKNGLPLLRGVVERVLAQRTPWPFELIAIDSGSRDGTVEFLRTRPLTLIEVPAASFGHGRTRNQAIAASTGAFVALLTQDALPADEHWLARLVAAVEQDERIAGAFGRHLAHTDADAATRRDLDEHFRHFAGAPPVVWIDDPARYARDHAWRRFLWFFSSNNACLRRAAWERHPLPDADFAEDQLWARTVLEAGWRKAYAHDAVVHHSHTFHGVERLRRSFDEARALTALGDRPCPSLAHAAWRVARQTARDTRVGAPLFAAAGDRLMTQLGLWLGQRHRHLPAALTARLSRDEELKAR